MSQTNAIRAVSSFLLFTTLLVGCNRAPIAISDANHLQEGIVVSQKTGQRVVIETNSAKATSLYIGDNKWGSSRIRNGEKALVTLELSDQIRLEDWSLGHGMIFAKGTGDSINKQFLAITKQGGLPYGRATMRDIDAFVKTHNSVTCADIKQADGSLIPISLRLEH